MLQELPAGLPRPPDFEYPPACIVIWGLNAAETNHPIYREILGAIHRGSTKLMLIDPMSIGLTSRADLWLRLRPGSDLALALGMINVIINEGLYDKAFVDKLEAHVQDYGPEKVERITWIEANAMREAARFYAENKPANILWVNAIDNNISSFQTARAISILRAITGNLGVPGGEVD